MLRRLSVRVNAHHICRNAFCTLLFAVALKQQLESDGKKEIFFFCFLHEAREAYLSLLQTAAVTGSCNPLARDIFGGVAALLGDLVVQHGDGDNDGDGGGGGGGDDVRRRR